MSGARPPLVVGIPTWCEVERIAAHTARVDAALTAASLPVESFIVNADNASPDGTRAAFTAVPTRHAKVALSTAGRGKGRNERALFEHALSIGALGLITLDADLEHIPDDWLPSLAEPLLDGTADVVLPLYARHWYDANQTNQVVAPLVLAVTGVPIRQPVGGDFAFSQAALRTLCASSWSDHALGFGWDVSMVLAGLRSGLEVVQRPLSHGKIHSWRSDSSEEIEREMATKFAELSGGALLELAGFEVDDAALPPFPESAPLLDAPRAYDVSHLRDRAAADWCRDRGSPAMRELAGGILETGAETTPALGDEVWARVLVRALDLVGGSTMAAAASTLGALRTLFFARCSSVLPLFRACSQSEIDAAVHGLAVEIRGRLIRPPTAADPASGGAAMDTTTAITDGTAVEEQRHDTAQRLAWNRYRDAGVTDLIGAFNLCWALQAASATGVLQALAERGTATAEELIADLDPHLGGHLLRYLEIKGVVTHEGERLRLTDWGLGLVEDTALAQIEFYVQAYGPVVSRMAPLLTGASAYGRDVERDGAALGRACATLFRVYHDPIVLEALDAIGARKVLDLGCGAGQFLLDACSRQPGLRAVGLDISDGAIAIAQQEARRLGLQDRLDFVVADAFQPDTWPAICNDADAIFGVGVLHEHFREGEGAVLGILARIAEQMRSGLVKSFILGEPELHYDDAEHDADLYLVHIFTQQGFPRRRESWLQLFERSELRCGRLWRRPGAGPRFAFYDLVAR